MSSQVAETLLQHYIKWRQWLWPLLRLCISNRIHNYFGAGSYQELLDMGPDNCFRAETWDCCWQIMLPSGCSLYSVGAATCLQPHLAALKSCTCSCQSVPDPPFTISHALPFSPPPTHTSDSFSPSWPSLRAGAPVSECVLFPVTTAWDWEPGSATAKSFLESHCAHWQVQWASTPQLLSGMCLRR